jgi:hypothetical protein
LHAAFRGAEHESGWWPDGFEQGQLHVVCVNKREDLANVSQIEG